MSAAGSLNVAALLPEGYPSADRVPYYYPPAPSPDAFEWEGGVAGVQNVITRTQSALALCDRNVDARPARRQGLLATAIHFVRQHASQILEKDVILHGCRVRLWTNSHHLADFWQDNWFSPEEWERSVGLPAPAEPRVLAYALCGVPTEPEGAYYSPAMDTVFLFNTASYEILQNWVLGAVARVLAVETGVHSVHGSCLEYHEQGILLVAPSNSGKSTCCYGLMALSTARFHSDEWVFLRYFWPTPGRQDRLASPQAVTLPDGRRLQGTAAIQWCLAQEQWGPAAVRVEAVNPEGRMLRLRGEDFDFSQPPAAQAYISEKMAYLRTALAQFFPEAESVFSHAKLENVPCVDPSGAPAPPEAEGCPGRPAARSAHCSPFTVCHQGRAMVDPQQLFGRARVWSHPWRGLPLQQVLFLRPGLPGGAAAPLSAGEMAEAFAADPQTACFAADCLPLVQALHKAAPCRTLDPALLAGAGGQGHLFHDPRPPRTA